MLLLYFSEDWSHDHRSAPRTGSSSWTILAKHVQGSAGVFLWRDLLPHVVSRQWEVEVHVLRGLLHLCGLPHSDWGLHNCIPRGDRRTQCSKALLLGTRTRKGIVLADGLLESQRLYGRHHASNFQGWARMVLTLATPLDPFHASDIHPLQECWALKSSQARSIRLYPVVLNGRNPHTQHWPLLS